MKCPCCLAGEMELTETFYDAEDTTYYYVCTHCDVKVHFSESDKELYWEFPTNWKPPTKIDLKDVIEYIKLNSPGLSLSLIRSLAPKNNNDLNH